MVEALQIYPIDASNLPTRRITVAAGTTISKGIALTLTDPRTGAKVSASNAVGAGVTSMEKDGTDSSTSVAAWYDGFFEGTASGAITLGAPVSFCANNYIMQTPLASLNSGAVVIGYSLETASDLEVFAFRMRL